MPESEEKPLVVIRSLVYNHEPYLRDCLEGFVMQQTTFPFVAVVHDDCSTDGSAAIIREYAEKYPHIIKPVYETENQYSKGTLGRAMSEACGKYGAKYYALCEGDDYWTDPHKLQKQVDFMETHPDFTLVFCNGVVQTPLGNLATQEDYQKAGWPYHNVTGEVSADKMIADHSWMVLTAGMLVRSDVYTAYQAIRKKCPHCKNGDAALQATCAVMGRSYCISDSMVVYRYQTAGSWSYKNSDWGKQEKPKAIPSSGIANMGAYIRMLDCINEYSHGKYEDIFTRVQFYYVAYRVRDYPESRREIVSKLGQYLRYDRVGAYMPRPRRGVFEKCFRLLQRCTHYPYYPAAGALYLVNPLFRTFYRGTEHKATIHVGPFNIASIVEGGSKLSFFLFGREII